MPTFAETAQRNQGREARHVDLALSEVFSGFTINVERAIFGSTRGTVADGYQVIASSQGIPENVTRAFSKWAPTQDAFVGATGSCYSYAKLEDWVLVAKTTQAESDYSHRRGGCATTDAFLTSSHDFAWFGSDPFALYDAALAATVERRSSRSGGQTVRPVKIARSMGRNAIQPLVDMTRKFGADRLVDLARQVQENTSVSVAWRGDRKKLIASVLALMPVKTRRDITYSTGLAPSTGRDFRLYGAPEVIRNATRFFRERMTVMIDLNNTKEFTQPPSPEWVEIHAFLRAQHWSEAEAWLADRDRE